MTKKGMKGIINVLLCLAMFVIGALSGFSVYAVTTITSDKLVFASSDLQIHFMELGNINAGDCIYIKAGDNDILIDAGSKNTSLPTIKAYLDKFVTDNTIEYAIVTHAHQDHYACYATNKYEDSLFNYYKYGTLIDFAGHNNTGSMYNSYENNIKKEIEQDGMTRYNALQCVEEKDGAKQVYELGSGITLKILDSYYYRNSATTENDYSVCFLLTQGENNYLFTGDLEEKGEKKLTELNDLPKCVLYKAGHHGSKTSSTDALLSVIQPEYVVVTCVAGSVEYTQKLENTFPTQIFINTVSKYTQNVYVTSMAEIKKNGTKYENVSFSSMNGNIVVYSKSNEVKFEFSNNDLKLKDTDWFKEYRICPQEWK